MTTATMMVTTAATMEEAPATAPRSRDHAEEQEPRSSVFEGARTGNDPRLEKKKVFILRFFLFLFLSPRLSFSRKRRLSSFFSLSRSQNRMRGAFAVPLQRAASSLHHHNTTARKTRRSASSIKASFKASASSSVASSISSFAISSSRPRSSILSFHSSIAMGGILSRLRGGDRCNVSASIR